ncbi:MAG TPA: D-glycero-beta-D-manno-heptose-7-phosphate kinase [Roseiarcus sp.]|nr:D-glycero-beta-D-manno-heptose-7-phosphate kinase [Roseiarcus sp.]
MLPAHSHASLLVVGDAMLDLYITGKVERISPEAPAPVLRHGGDREVAGGAANVAANIARLGATARLIAPVGEDAEAGRLAQLLTAAGVAFDPIIDPSRPTTVKTRVMSGSHQLLRVDRETDQPIAKEFEETILARIDAALPHVRGLILSDYAKGALTDVVLKGAIAAARAQGVPVFVDPKRRDFSPYAGASMITPNRGELATATNLPCNSDEEIEHAARALIAATGAEILVTRSEKGMSFIAEGAAPIHMPTKARQVFDVSGAGDTVIATIACCRVAGVPIEQTMRLANLAAGVVVGKPGAATVSWEELRLSADDHEMPSLLRKGALASRDEAASIREHWRREGLEVGFTNGCFDLLHPGHIATLRFAGRHCDRLIVGLNGDASVARLKGPSRPLQDEKARATVLGAIHCVDLVVIFDEDTPEGLIAALKPDALIKGADYAESDIVGADIVKAAGGRVLRAPLVEGQSTSGLIARGAAEVH